MYNLVVFFGNIGPSNPLSIAPHLGHPFLQQTKGARIFRRAHVRTSSYGTAPKPLPDAPTLPHSRSQQGVHRLSNQEHTGLVDRPRPGRPPTLNGENTQSLADQDLQHGSSHSQWSFQELATVPSPQTGLQLSRESVRCALKKTHKLQPPHRSAYPHTRCPRWPTRLAALEYCAWRDHFAL